MTGNKEFWGYCFDSLFSYRGSSPKILYITNIVSYVDLRKMKKAVKVSSLTNG